MCLIGVQIKGDSHFHPEKFIFPPNPNFIDSGKMSILELDSKGRLTIPKEVREYLKIGMKVLIINAGDHLKIIPLPSNPFTVLHGAFNIKKPFKELRKQAEQIGEKEATKTKG